MAMDKLVEGAKVVYVLSEQEAKSINQHIAKYPDQQAVGTKVVEGQRTMATVVRSRGPNDAGEERLALRLDGTTPSEKAYHVGASDVRYMDGAWHKVENSR
jgi:hypothetical protein